MVLIRVETFLVSSWAKTFVSPLSTRLPINGNVWLVCRWTRDCTEDMRLYTGMCTPRTLPLRDGGFNFLETWDNLRLTVVVSDQEEPHVLLLNVSLLMSQVDWLVSKSRAYVHEILLLLLNTMLHLAHVRDRRSGHLMSLPPWFTTSGTVCVQSIILSLHSVVGSTIHFCLLTILSNAYENRPGRPLKSDKNQFPPSSSVFISFFFIYIQPGAVKLILCGHWMHLSYMHPVTSENHFHCTRLYLGTSEDKTRKQLSSKNLLLKLKLEKCARVVHVVLFLFDKVLSLTPNDQSSQQQISIFSKLKV